MSVVKKALFRSLPVLSGYIVLGIGFGILLRNAGYGVPWSFAMALFIYAGSMQYVGVGLISSGASLLTAAITTLMVNARHLLYSISMIDRYRDAGIFRPYLIFSLTDETYSLLCEDSGLEKAENIRYQFFVSFFNHCYWIIGCVLGSLLGAVLPFSAAGIEFSMTALFVTSFTEQWLSGRNHSYAITGLCSTLFCLLLFGLQYFLIPSMILITLILSLLQVRQNRKETLQ